MTKLTKKNHTITSVVDYHGFLGDITALLETARRQAARSVNAILTATYWEIGRRIVEFEQKGKKRAGYGKALLKKLSTDLTKRYGRGFSERNLEQMRLFYLLWPISQTPSAKSLSRTNVGKIHSPTEKSQTLSAEFDLAILAERFPLPWSAYVRLLSVKDKEARTFYESEALRGVRSVRQLEKARPSMTTLNQKKTAPCEIQFAFHGVGKAACLKQHPSGCFV